MDLTLIVALLSAVAQRIPEIAAIVPVIKKIIDGETVSESEAAAVYAAIQALEAMVAAREQAALKA